MTSTFQLQSCIFYKLGMGLFTPGARRSSRGVFQDGGVVIFISWLSVALNAGNWDLGDTHSNTVLYLELFIHWNKVTLPFSFSIFHLF